MKAINLSDISEFVSQLMKVLINPALTKIAIKVNRSKMRNQTPIFLAFFGIGLF